MTISDEFINCEMLAEQFIRKVQMARKLIEAGNTEHGIQQLELLEREMEHTLAMGELYNFESPNTQACH